MNFHFSTPSSYSNGRKPFRNDASAGLRLRACVNFDDDFPGKILPFPQTRQAERPASFPACQ
jgi:hypothetical protein